MKIEFHECGNGNDLSGSVEPFEVTDGSFVVIQAAALNTAYKGSEREMRHNDLGYGYECVVFVDCRQGQHFLDSKLCRDRQEAEAWLSERCAYYSKPANIVSQLVWDLEGQL